MYQKKHQAAEFRAEYRLDKKVWIFKPLAGVMGTTDSALYGYGGVLVDVYFGRRWVLTPSFAAGYYEKGDGRDLGHELEFRSSIELSYRFDNRTRLGLSFYHLSNANIGDFNRARKFSASFTLSRWVLITRYISIDPLGCRQRRQA